MALLSFNFKTQIKKTALKTGSSLFKIVSQAMKAPQLFGKPQFYKLMYYSQLLLIAMSNDCSISGTHLLVTLFKCDSFMANNSILVTEVALLLSE